MNCQRRVGKETVALAQFESEVMIVLVKLTLNDNTTAFIPFLLPTSTVKTFCCGRKVLPVKTMDWFL